jgi:hypothetical protein
MYSDINNKYDKNSNNSIKNSIKIAVVKSEIYQDLWISNITTDINTIFKTSLMRCSPIGLLEYAETEFIIINDTNEYPSKEYTFIAPYHEQQTLKYDKQVKIAGLPFLDNTHHKHTTINEVAHNVDSINWSKYQIIITINACIPDRVIQKYPNILWCYYISENEEYFMNKLMGNYDLLLNQDVQNEIFNSFSIGFPYTFLGPNTLETLSEIKNIRNGIFMEINNTKERPVKQIPEGFQEISNATNIPIFIHNQNIIENLKILSKSKYFVKLYGRKIRGNAILEAISSGTLVLLNKDLLIYNNLIPNECHIVTPEDAIEKIRYFENEPNEYKRFIQIQKKILEENYALNPLNNLYKKYYEKIKQL